MSLALPAWAAPAAKLASETGAPGLNTTVSAQSTDEGEYMLSARAGYFGGSNDVARYYALFQLAGFYGIRDGFAGMLAIRSTATDAVAGGLDIAPGLMGMQQFGSFHIGAMGRLLLTHEGNQRWLAIPATGFETRFIASWDAVEHNLPLVLHLNVGFTRDRTRYAYADATKLSSSAALAGNVSQANWAMLAVGATYTFKGFSASLEHLLKISTGFPETPGSTLVPRLGYTFAEGLSFVLDAPIRLTNVADLAPAPRWLLIAGVTWSVGNDGDATAVENQPMRLPPSDVEAKEVEALNAQREAVIAYPREYDEPKDDDAPIDSILDIEAPEQKVAPIAVARAEMAPPPPPIDEIVIEPTPAPVPEPTPAPVPEPTPAPAPEPTPAPVPEPTPAPVPEPTPAPVPEPTPAPVPEPTPAPAPEPTPAPVPEPTPAPAPEPTPAPAPEPTPAPEPEPTPAPVPEPTPAPEPAPPPIDEIVIEPTPAPVPEPTPAPVPEPTPAPVPEPTPAPVPEPTPAPVPEPTPAPVPEPTPAPVPEPTPAPVPEPTPAPVPEPTPAPAPKATLLALNPSFKRVTPEQRDIDALITNVVAVLKANPSLSVRVQAHADPLGDPNYNLWLSDQRAQTYKNLIVAQGIETSRITTVGYGATRPLDNAQTIDARARNRRVEIVATARDPSALGHATSDPAIKLPQSTKQSVLKLDQHIYFAFGVGSALAPFDVATMSEVSAILHEHPQFRVHIVGHSDSQGQAAANHILSLQRANAARAHLIQRGVDRSRISIEGQGSNNPLVPNTTPENRAKNRRAEFWLWLAE